MQRTPPENGVNRAGRDRHEDWQREPMDAKAQTVEPDRLPRSLVCLGDSGDIATWSNTPYFLFRAASEAGFLTHTMNLVDPAYRARRLAWLLRAPLRLERPGGYQWSRSAVQRMWEQVPAPLRRGEMLSHCQIFPPPPSARAAGVRFSFYCDATLRQLFDAGGAGGIGRRTRREALRQEVECYRSARFFIGMARATVESAVRDCGADPSRAFAVRPGANLDEPAVRAFLADRGPSWRQRGEPDAMFTAAHPARLGFIGRDWKRKGLPRLVGAAEVLHRRGRPVRVTVVGHCPEHLRRHPLVEALGFVSKATDMPRFLKAVDSFALGCLPSHFEPLGISTLEALRLGVPVLGADTGGIPDCVPAGAGFLVPAAATAEDIADAVEHHLFDPDRYAGLVRGAAAESENVTWARTVEQLMRIWTGGAGRAEAGRAGVGRAEVLARC